MSEVVQLEPKSKPKIPEFIKMSDVRDMTDDQLDEMLAAIRTRRMVNFSIYRATEDEKSAINAGKVREKIDKKCDQIIKDLNTIDKAFEKLEQHIAELRGLRLQAEMTLI